MLASPLSVGEVDTFLAAHSASSGPRIETVSGGPEMPHRSRGRYRGEPRRCRFRNRDFIDRGRGLESELASPNASTELIVGVDLASENDSFGTNVEFSDLGAVVTGSRVFSTSSARLTSDSARRYWSTTTLSARCDMPISDSRVRPKELRALVGHHQTDAATRESLGQGIHHFPEADFVGRREQEVAEAVDDDSTSVCPFDAREEVVDPFVDVQVDR